MKGKKAAQKKAKRERLMREAARLAVPCRREKRIVGMQTPCPRPSVGGAGGSPVVRGVRLLGGPYIRVGVAVGDLGCLSPEREPGRRSPSGQ